jgi:hypothetical protein
MSETSTLISYQCRTISRQDLALIRTPAGTSTHVPVPHHEIVQALVETLGFRHIRVAADEYAVSPDGMKMFGVLESTPKIVIMCDTVPSRFTVYLTTVCTLSTAKYAVLPAAFPTALFFAARSTRFV